MTVEIVTAERLRPGDQIVTTDSTFTLAYAALDPEDETMMRLRSTKGEQTANETVLFSVPRTCKFERVRRDATIVTRPDLRHNRRGAR